MMAPPKNSANGLTRRSNSLEMRYCSGNERMIISILVRKKKKKIKELEERSLKETKHQLIHDSLG